MKTWIPIFLLTGSCGNAVVRLEAPADVDLFAVLDLGDDGEIVSSTGLAEMGSSGILWSKTDRAYVVGFRTKDLTAAGLEQNRRPDVPLETAVGCDQKLPTPAFFQRWEQAEAVKADPIPLTSAWVRDICPEIAPTDVALEVSCFEFPCARTISQTSRCAFTMQSECAELEGVAKIAVYASGKTCVEINSTGWSCEQTNTTLRCTEPAECEARVHLDPNTFSMDVDVVDAFPEAPDWAPPVSLTNRKYPPRGRAIGYLQDLAVVGDSVFVSSGPGTPLERCTTQDIESRLLTIDADSLSVSTATAPSCLTQLTASSHGSLLGIFVGGDLSVAEWQDGSLIRRTPLGAPAPVECLLVTGLERHGDELGVTLTTSGFDGCPNSSWFGRTSQLATGPASWTELPGEEVWDLTWSEDRWILAAEGGQSPTAISVSEGGEILNRVPAPLGEGLNSTVATDVTFDPVSGRTIFLTARDRPAVYAFLPDDAEPKARAVAFERPSQPTTAIALPDGPMLIGGTWQDGLDWPSDLSFYDAAEGRYLQGGKAVGFGAVSEMRLDRRDRIWILYPWEGKIRRVAVGP